jgi:hypothetical protein
MASSGMLCPVPLVRTDVSEQLSVSMIKVRRIDEIGKLALTSNRPAAKKYKYAFRLIVWPALRL